MLLYNAWIAKRLYMGYAKAQKQEEMIKWTLARPEL